MTIASGSIAAVLAAGGSGQRFSPSGTLAAKQFRTLLARPLYLWSLRELCLNPDISRVVVSVPQSQVSEIKEDLALRYIKDILLTHLDMSKIAIIAGGESRQDTVRMALEFLASEASQPEFVLVHDAARPFVTRQMIEDTIVCVRKTGACSIGVPVSDTIKQVRDGQVVATVDRSELIAVQTPQAGRFEWLLEAHRKAYEEDFVTTDDAAILESSGKNVYIVESSPYNLKITHPKDLEMAEALAHLFLPKVI